MFFGRTSFRPGQKEVISALLEGRDVLALWPTGAGKSLTYQLPALLLYGLTIVVSPLIALMEDQVRRLSSIRGAAAFLSCNQSSEEKNEILEKIKRRLIKILFLAPERLASESFRQELKNVEISLMAVDEAHCISQWGHDFRPCYLYLGDTVRTLRPRAILAVTATADDDTAEQIISTLGMQKPLISKLSLDRPNLNYTAEQVPAGKRSEVILSKLKKGPLPAAVYVSRRAEAETVAARLRAAGLKALPYHAGLKPELRQQVQELFLSDEAEIITATIAFGMGVDKPNIRQVIHTFPPLSPEGYFQESGRAGRSGCSAWCTLLWDSPDFFRLEQNLADKYPCAEDVRNFCLLTETKPPAELRGQFLHLSCSAWDMLLRAAFGMYHDPELCLPLKAECEDIVNYFAALLARGRSRLKVMKDYCTAKTCRRRILLKSFGEAAPPNCAGCDICLRKQFFTS